MVVVMPTDEPDTPQFSVEMATPLKCRFEAKKVSECTNTSLSTSSNVHSRPMKSYE
jgi:hypothetical protein